MSIVELNARKTVTRSNLGRLHPPVGAEADEEHTVEQDAQSVPAAFVTPVV